MGASAVEIMWHGEANFSLRGTDAFVAVNPPEGSGHEDPTVIIEHSRPAADAPAGGGRPFRIDGPGEFEVGPVFVIGVDGRPSESGDGRRHTVYAARFDGVSVCVVGLGAAPPDDAAVAALGDVDVLLAPVGADGLSAADTAELVGRIEPSIVIPAAVEGADSPALASFLTEMGASQLEAEASFRALPSRMPEETKVALLSPAPSA